MKQFNLEEYLKNPKRKIVTRDGRSARIICTDRNKDKIENHPIIALIPLNEREIAIYYTANGYYFSEMGPKDPMDLFFAPEKHEGVMRENTIIAGPFISKNRADIRIEDNDYKSVKITWEI